MRHADLVDIREAHGKPDVDLVLVLLNGVQFISDIAGRLLDTEKDAVAQDGFSHKLSLCIFIYYARLSSRREISSAMSSHVMSRLSMIFMREIM